MYKAPIPLETLFPLVTQRELNEHKQHEIYMANSIPSHWGPNGTYIFHLLAMGVCVGGNTNFRVCVGGHAHFRVCVGGKTDFRVCIGSAKLF